MSRPHDGHRPFFPFGNPFRMIFPKGSYPSSDLRALLNTFEETLAERLKKLVPKDSAEILSLSWMRLAMESLCETHADIKILVTKLQFPISDWDEKWMDMYLDDSVKLLDICIAFSSELSRLNQGQLLLQYALHILEASSNFPMSEQLIRAHASLHDWMQQSRLRNPKLENCSVLSSLAESLCLAKYKNSAKEKVLMQAMYGVKVETIFVCSVFVAAFSCSAKPLMDLHIADKFLWSETFNDLQANVNGQIRSLSLTGSVMILKELEAVDGCVEKLYALTDAVDHEEAETLRTSADAVDHEEAETLQTSALCLSKSAERLAQGLDLLSKQVESFFQIVLSGRDALLGNLRECDLNQENNVAEPVAR